MGKGSGEGLPFPNPPSKRVRRSRASPPGGRSEVASSSKPTSGEIEPCLAAPTVQVTIRFHRLRGLAPQLGRDRVVDDACRMRGARSARGVCPSRSRDRVLAREPPSSHARCEAVTSARSGGCRADSTPRAYSTFHADLYPMPRLSTRWMSCAYASPTDFADSGKSSPGVRSGFGLASNTNARPSASMRRSMRA